MHHISDGGVVWFLPSNPHARTLIKQVFAVAMAATGDIHQQATGRSLACCWCIPNFPYYYPPFPLKPPAALYGLCSTVSPVPQCCKRNQPFPPFKSPPSPPEPQAPSPPFVILGEGSRVKLQLSISKDHLRALATVAHCQARRRFIC